MHRDWIQENVKAIFAQYVDAREIRMESSMQNDFFMDSVMLVELMLTLERRFSVIITDEEATKLKTPNDVLELIAKKLEIE